MYYVYQELNKTKFQGGNHSLVGSKMLRLPAALRKEQWDHYRSIFRPTSIQKLGKRELWREFTRRLISTRISKSNCGNTIRSDSDNANQNFRAPTSQHVPKIWADNKSTLRSTRSTQGVLCTTKTQLRNQIPVDKEISGMRWNAWRNIQNWLIGNYEFDNMLQQDRKLQGSELRSQGYHLHKHFGQGRHLHKHFGITQPVPRKIMHNTSWRTAGRGRCVLRHKLGKMCTYSTRSKKVPAVGRITAAVPPQCISSSSFTGNGQHCRVQRPFLSAHPADSTKREAPLISLTMFTPVKSFMQRLRDR